MYLSLEARGTLEAIAIGLVKKTPIACSDRHRSLSIETYRLQQQVSVEVNGNLSLAAIGVDRFNTNISQTIGVGLYQ